MDNVSTIIKRRLSLSSKNELDDYLKQIVSYIKNGNYNITYPTMDIDMTVKYLKRTDVNKQFRKIIKEYNIIELNGNLRYNFDVIFLLAEAKTVNNDIYILNFWPCSDFENIGVIKKEYRDRYL